MKTKDFLLVALLPCALLLIPLVGTRTVEGWNWSIGDFTVMWLILAGATYVYRLLATRPMANLAYRLGAGLAVVGGFLITWVNLAVQIIGNDNPGNLLYFLALLGSLIGVGLARFQPRGLAKVAFALAGVLLLIPVVSVALWPEDFSPGFARVFMLNGVFVLLFTAAGLLFRQAAEGNSGFVTAS